MIHHSMLTAPRRESSQMLRALVLTLLGNVSGAREEESLKIMCATANG